jgi:hypothetical protein
VPDGSVLKDWHGIAYHLFKDKLRLHFNKDTMCGINSHTGHPRCGFGIIAAYTIDKYFGGTGCKEKFGSSGPSSPYKPLEWDWLKDD